MKKKTKPVKPRVRVQMNTGSRIHKNKKRPHRREYNPNKDRNE